METSALVCGEEMMRGSVRAALPFSDQKGPLICPKPKRVGLFDSPRHMSLRWRKRSVDCEQMDSKAQAELLDLILNKDDNGYGEALYSTPFCSGSPPSRVSNPIVQDVNFGKEKKLSPSSTLQFSPSSPSGFLSSPTASPSHKGGCSARTKFGLKPAAIRIEGFECLLGRDHKNSGITAAMA